MSTKEQPRWIVSRIKGNKSAYIATVRAKDADSVIKFVMKDAGITDPEPNQAIGGAVVAR